MLRFRNLGQDINTGIAGVPQANAPETYRVWMTNNEPDLTGAQYTGVIGGSIPLQNILTYAITDDNAIVDFVYPQGSIWNPVAQELGSTFPIRSVLPQTIEDSQLVVIGSNIYLFGGKGTSHIFMANNSNPCYWIDTGYTLPSELYGACFAIYGSNLYLFGGYINSEDGYGPSNIIYSAAISSPLSWSQVGTLPYNVQYASLAMYNNIIYLLGGWNGNSAINTILKTNGNPLTWQIAAGHLTTPVYGSTIAQINSNFYLYGGMLNPFTPTNQIWFASEHSLESWSLASGSLPYASAFNQFFSIGDQGYLIGSMTNLNTSIPPLAQTGFTPILQNLLSAPTVFADTQQVIRGILSHFQIAIIQDRVFTFGGSGSSLIFACNQNIKYNLDDPDAIEYANITRLVLPGTNNSSDPFQALGFAYWLTDYTL